MSDSFTGELKETIIPHKIKNGLVRIPNIKNIIAVTSGKGGVGKSTTAVNLAISLSKLGLNIGLLDADIYGPSVPILVGEKSFKPDVAESKFVPLTKFGMKILSFGFLVAETQPAIWRGAIVNKALDQLLFDTVWGELDCLILDMPPGTGDIHLTMCQKMPITAVVSVTTPQDIALLDVIKSLEMYKKMDIPCLGIIENMSIHICSNCGHKEDIFGSFGGETLAKHYGLDLLAKLPLNIEIRKGSDAGLPTAYTKNEVEFIYNELAKKLLSNLSKLGKDYSSKIGKVGVIKGS